MIKEISGRDKLPKQRSTAEGVAKEYEELREDHEGVIENQKKVSKDYEVICVVYEKLHTRLMARRSTTRYHSEHSESITSYTGCQYRVNTSINMEGIQKQ